MLYFIHGLNGIPDNWLPCIDFFSKQGLASRAIDFRKDKDLQKTQVKDYVDTISCQVAEHDVLIGHSMGGLLVQKVAEQKNIKAGICICPAPPKGISMKSISLFDQLKYIPYIVGNRPFKISYSLARKLFLNGMSEKQARFAYERLHEESAKVTYEVMKNKTEVDEAKVTSPLFFISVEEDKTCPPDLVRKIAEKYDSTVKVLPGSHYIFAHIDPINQELLRIIKQIRYTE